MPLKPLPVLSLPRDRRAIEARLTPVSATSDPKTERAVAQIIARVRREGDRALLAYSKEFDTHPVTAAREMVRGPEALLAAWRELPGSLRAALREAARRITRFHRHQRSQGFLVVDEHGNRLTQQVLPLRSVGIYVPGGTASYPSSLLMNAIPARVAGVEQIVMVTPPQQPSLGHLATLGAAHLAGIDTVYLTGGAQAVAALACGTQTIPRVDKVVGPGNRWVATAKRLLYGQIDIDSVAGPTEVLIVADRTANPDHLAADMLAQAEHDPDSSAILILVGDGVDLPAIQRSLADRTAQAPRRQIITKSLTRHGLIIRVRTAEEAVALANLRAPEHCEVIMRGARRVAGQIRDAAALFIGPWSPEPVGDYAAGPNHVLPTGRTARFFSPLGVHDFVKRNHLIECTRRGFEALLPTVRALAEAEGLSAHRGAMDARAPRRFRQ